MELLLRFCIYMLHIQSVLMPLKFTESENERAGRWLIMLLKDILTGIQWC